MGEETVYQYDGAGNLTEKIDAKNQKTEYIYDDAGRLTDIRYFNSDYQRQQGDIYAFMLFSMTLKRNMR